MCNKVYYIRGWFIYEEGIYQLVDAIKDIKGITSIEEKEGVLWILSYKNLIRFNSMKMYGKELNIHLTIRLIINSQIMFRVESIARDQAIGTLQQKNREDFLIKVTFP